MVPGRFATSTSHEGDETIVIVVSHSFLTTSSPTARRRSPLGSSPVPRRSRWRRLDQRDHRAVLSSEHPVFLPTVAIVCGIGIGTAAGHENQKDRCEQALPHRIVVVCAPAGPARILPTRGGDGWLPGGRSRGCLRPFVHSSRSPPVRWALRDSNPDLRLVRATERAVEAEQP